MIYSFEKRRIHYEVIANDLHLAEKWARKLAKYETDPIYPKDGFVLRKKLRDHIEEILKKL